MTAEQVSRARHVLSPSERWMQLRRSKPPSRFSSQRPSPRPFYGDKLLYLTLALPIMIVVPLYFMYPDLLVTPPPLRPYGTLLPPFAERSANFSKPTTLVLSAGHHDEFISVYRPLLLAELKRPLERRYVSVVTVMTNHTTRCTNFAQNSTLRGVACRTLATSLAHADAELAHARIANDSHLVGAPVTCTPSTIVILSLSPSDASLRMLLQRLLLAHATMQRAYHAPSWLNVPPVRAVILLVPHKEMYNLVRPGASTAHSVLTHAILSRDNVAVSVTQSLRRQRPACFEAGLVLGRLHERFALPDGELGALGRYRDSETVLPVTLSADALALRNQVIPPPGPPPMRNRLVYASSNPNTRGSLDLRADAALRDLFDEIARTEGVELGVLELRHLEMPILQQISALANASVLVGVQGTMLELAPFMPQGAALVEIAPEGSISRLYESLKACGIDYIRVPLSTGTLSADGTSSITDVDKELLRHFVSDKLHDGKTIVHRSIEDMYV